MPRTYRDAYIHDRAILVADSRLRSGFRVGVVGTDHPDTCICSVDGLPHRLRMHVFDDGAERLSWAKDNAADHEIVQPASAGENYLFTVERGSPRAAGTTLNKAIKYVRHKYKVSADEHLARWKARHADVIGALVMADCSIATSPPLDQSVHFRFPGDPEGKFYGEVSAMQAGMGATWRIRHLDAHQSFDVPQEFNWAAHKEVRSLIEKNGLQNEMHGSVCRDVDHIDPAAMSDFRKSFEAYETGYGALFDAYMRKPVAQRAAEDEGFMEMLRGAANGYPIVGVGDHRSSLYQMNPDLGAAIGGPIIPRSYNQAGFLRGFFIPVPSQRRLGVAFVLTAAGRALLSGDLEAAEKTRDPEDANPNGISFEEAIEAARADCQIDQDSRRDLETKLAQVELRGGLADGVGVHIAVMAAAAIAGMVRFDKDDDRYAMVDEIAPAHAGP